MQSDFLTSPDQPETWAPAPGYEGLYEVSDQGRVRSLDRTIEESTARGRVVKRKGRILKPQYRKNTGYLMVGLSKGGIVKDWYIHRLVLMAFCGAPKLGEEACHGNDVRTDNRLENLRWDSHRSNVHDARKRGRARYVVSERNAAKTHCPRNHPYDESNTVWHNGKRSCRECRRINERARYHKAKLAS